MQGRKLSNLNFWVLKVKKVKFRSVEKWGMDAEMSPYLSWYKYLVEKVYWWNIAYCMGVWEVVFDFWFLKIFTWFLSGAKVWVEKSFLVENIKMDIGQFFQLIYAYCSERMYKSSIWSNLFYLGVYWVSSHIVNVEWKQQKIWLKKVTQIRVSQNRATKISSNHCKLHGAIFRRFEELGPICELLETVSKIEESEIKSPAGSICQKYVYSSFMVKMRIDLGSFGLFWFILGWG